MNGSCSSCFALTLALLGAGCSLGDFAYLSTDYGQGGLSGGAAAGAGGIVTAGGDGGSGALAGSESLGGNATAGSGGGEDVNDAFFCDPKYSVFDGAKLSPAVDLLESGDYMLRRPGNAHCLLTPDWPELGDSKFWAITQDCGGPPTANPLQPGEAWHLEHLCSDIYRFTINHGTPEQRQLGIMDETEVGTPVYSVASEGNLDPFLVFHLRAEAPVDSQARWRFSPAISSSSCIEESGTAHYGDLDVTRVVIYPCNGSLSNQSWNLVPVP